MILLLRSQLNAAVLGLDMNLQNEPERPFAEPGKLPWKWGRLDSAFATVAGILAVSSFLLPAVGSWTYPEHWAGLAILVFLVVFAPNICRRVTHSARKLGSYDDLYRSLCQANVTLLHLQTPIRAAVTDDITVENVLIFNRTISLTGTFKRRMLLKKGDIIVFLDPSDDEFRSMGRFKVTKVSGLGFTAAERDGIDALWRGDLIAKGRESYTANPGWAVTILSQ